MENRTRAAVDPDDLRNIAEDVLESVGALGSAAAVKRAADEIEGLRAQLAEADAVVFASYYGRTIDGHAMERAVARQHEREKGNA